MKRLDSHSGLFLTLAEWEFLDHLQSLGYVIEATAYRNSHGFAITDGAGSGWWIFDVADDLRAGPPLRVETGREDTLVEFVIFIEFRRDASLPGPSLSEWNDFLADGDAAKRERDEDDRRYADDFFAAEYRFGEMAIASFAAVGCELDAAYCGCDDYGLDSRWEVAQLRAA